MKGRETAEVTVIEKLKSETRICPGCMLEVRHPFIERCPRCYSLLPKLVLECAGCLHSAVCPVAGTPGRDEGGSNR